MTEPSAVPDFDLPATGNPRFRLSAFKGHPFGLYFYPTEIGVRPPFPLTKSLLGNGGLTPISANMYGRQVRGIERSTFVVDREGRIVKEWRGIKVPGHAREVLDYVRSGRL
jgi:peroxiredoxin Q/BCP